MFELWELDSQDQNPDTGSNTSRFAVRVLYNSEPMVLPGASPAHVAVVRAEQRGDAGDCAALGSVRGRVGDVFFQFMF